MRIEDETLIAYLDAQLEDDAQYALVEDALAESAGLRARLQALAESGELARRAFDAKFEEAVPPQLVAAIMNAPLPRAPASTTETPMPGQTERPLALARNEITARPAAPGLGARLAAWFGQGFGGAAAFASVCTLALGALLGHYLLPPTALVAPLARQGDPIHNPAVVVALQAAPSGLAIDLGDARLEIMASFNGRDGQFCREYSLSGPKTGQEVGVACRDGAVGAGWQLAFVTSEATSPPAQGGYGTASDRLHEAVDAYLSNQIDGEPFDIERERALIERGWTKD